MVSNKTLAKKFALHKSQVGTFVVKNLISAAINDQEWKEEKEEKKQTFIQNIDTKSRDLSPTKKCLSFFKKVENPLLEQSDLAIGTLNLDYRVFSISRAVPIYPVTWPANYKQKNCTSSLRSRYKILHLYHSSKYD